MTRCSWRQGAYCITGILGEIDVPHENFGSSCMKGISPLWWRVPILLWALIILTWSMLFFWGPTEEFFLYMTHWGLLFIVVEMTFGIIVTLKAPCGTQTEHPSPANFYVSCWQINRSSVPLLVLRSFLFLLSTCVLLSSMVMVPLTWDVHVGYWFIYLSHWGLILIVLTTAFSTAVSASAYFNRPIDATFGLPWYVKTYWVLYNITIPVAFLITVFYWGVLKASSGKAVNYAPNPVLDAMVHGVNSVVMFVELACSVHPSRLMHVTQPLYLALHSTGKAVNYAPNPVLDAMVHGVNSVVMFVELACSAHPSRLMHVMQPLYFAGAYMLFTVSYYFAGGLDPWGNPFIYPVVDWSKPEQTLVVITLTALFLALMHLITVGVATARDAISRKRINDTNGIYNDGFGA